MINDQTIMGIFLRPLIRPGQQGYKLVRDKLERQVLVKYTKAAHRGPYHEEV